MSDTKDWVSETRARCEAATEGPWSHVNFDGPTVVSKTGRHVKDFK